MDIKVTSNHFEDGTNCIHLDIRNTPKQHSFVTVSVYTSETELKIFNLSKQDIYSLAEKLINEANKIQEDVPSET